MLHDANLRPHVGERCQSCAATKNGFCGYLDATSLAKFAVRCHRTAYSQGSEIAGQGEEIDKVGVIASGLVKLATITESGDEFVLQILHEGQIAGAPGEGGDGFALEAATDVSICWVPRAAWDAFLCEKPPHFQAYTSSLTAQCDETRKFIMGMRGRNTVQRLASWLLDQCKETGCEEKPCLRVPLSRRDLASLLDMTVETLCRAVHQLDDRKAIRLLASDLFEITDIVKLRVLAKRPNENAAPVAAEFFDNSANRDSWTGDDIAMPAAPLR